MKGVIFYYSATGNTKLGCEYISRNINNVPFELINIAKNNNVNISEHILSYDLVGFAAPAEFWDPPYLMRTFIDKLPQQNGTPAFVFNTYGLFSGKTLKTLGEWVTAKGFTVLGGFSLQTPENYPPLVARGITSNNAPKSKDIIKFNRFITELNDLLASLSPNDLKPVKLNPGFINSLIPIRPRTAAKKDMGEKYVDQSLCTECGLCKRECPYNAIELNPKPVFNMDKCYGCWSCFNHCPTRAIFTDKFRGRGHYPGPPKSLIEKLQ